MVDEVIPGKDLDKQGGTFLALGKGFLWGFRVFGGSLGFGGRGKETLFKGATSVGRPLQTCSR